MSGLAVSGRRTHTQGEAHAYGESYPLGSDLVHESNVKEGGRLDGGAREGVAVPWPVYAQAMSDADGASAMEPGDILRLRFVQRAELSPDGRRVVHAVTGVDERERKDRVTLYLLDVDTGVQRQLTAGRSSDTNPTWSP